eukprot:8905222-Pyramimonas_sp.AAC.1
MRRSGDHHGATPGTPRARPGRAGKRLVLARCGHSWRSNSRSSASARTTRTDTGAGVATWRLCVAS